MGNRGKPSMILDYHLNQMSWRTILSELVSMGYKSHQAGTCGLHCHVNRSSLGEDYEKQESTIARILYFVEHNWDKMLSFSRRTEAYTILLFKKLEFVTQI